MHGLTIELLIAGVLPQIYILFIVFLLNRSNVPGAVVPRCEDSGLPADIRDQDLNP